MRKWFKSRRQRWIFATLCAVLAVVSLPLVWFASNAGATVYSYLFLTRPTTQELMGEYSVGTSRGQAHLVLRQDGTFRELLTSSGNVIDSAEGHWQNVSSNDDNAAVLIIAPHIVMGEDFNSSGAKSPSLYLLNQNSARYTVKPMKSVQSL